MVFPDCVKFMSNSTDGGNKSFGMISMTVRVHLPVTKTLLPLLLPLPLELPQPARRMVTHNVESIPFSNRILTSKRAQHTPGKLRTLESVKNNKIEGAEFLVWWEPRATPRVIPRPAPGSLAACHTCATVAHRTSPILAPHSPARFVHSPIPPVPESPPDEFVLARCDAAPAPTARGRCAPAGPGSAHRVGHLFDCSC